MLTWRLPKVTSARSRRAGCGPRVRRRGFPILMMAAVMSMAAAPQSALVRARQLYNQQQYDAAIDAAVEARKIAASVDVASLVFARAHLERFRLAANAVDLGAARDALRQVNSTRLTSSERVELLIGLGEMLYLDDRCGAAAEQFDLAVAQMDRADPNAGRALEWWASALDRQAQLDPATDQQALYALILRRMEDELRRDAGSAVASYWVAAAARGVGDLQRAWDAAIAGWVRARLAGDRSVALRADLDRLVRQAVIPERARQMASSADPQQAAEAMRVEWDRIKEQWTDR
jgi:hypothetical protein